MAVATTYYAQVHCNQKANVFRYQNSSKALANDSADAFSQKVKGVEDQVSKCLRAINQKEDIGLFLDSELTTTAVPAAPPPS